ncbi:MAG: hypothetical protein HC848_09520 [Limnobacter sp.]|nr:hypothetical protein [Limnobacter sp.]
MARPPGFNSQQISHHLERHAQSGLNIAQYCKEHHIKPGCFYNWRSTRNKKTQQLRSNTAEQQAAWLELIPPALQPAVQPSIQARSAPTNTVVGLSLPGGMVLQIKAV